MTRDLRTLIYLLNLELREECSRTLGWNPAGAASRCMQSGSSSRSGRNQGAAVEADAIREQQSKRMRSGAAVEADASGEQQPKRTRSGAAAEANAIEEQQLEADANGEKQLKRTQSAAGGKRTQSGSSSSAQRAVRRRITHGRRTRGKYVAE